MKNRNIPFGYWYQNGEIQPHPKESMIVKLVFTAYCNNSSLLDIAERLQRDGVEYLSGKTQWNRSRIKRIIEDTRYLGERGYPILIEETQFSLAQAKRTAKNTQKNVDWQCDVFQIKALVHCGTCGSRMLRRHFGNRKCAEYWCCSALDCRMTVDLPDEALLARVKVLLDRLTADPEMLDTNPKQNEPSKEYQKRQNRLMEELTLAGKYDEKLAEKIMELMSYRFDELDATPAITKMLQTRFRATGKADTFSCELCNDTVARILLDEMGEIELELLNGMRVKENLLCQK